jgi:class 3 adenylate cyclase
VSVLFVDVVGYTAIAERLGEEKTFAFVRRLYDILVDVVREHGGAVRGFSGDSIMAVFGIPDAYEDSALRACRTALATHAAVKATGESLDVQFGVRPIMRAGVSSGFSVMAAVEGEGAPLTAIGDTVNLAARLQALATDGGTLICETTQHLVQWVAETAFDGDKEIKGKSQRQRVWRLASLRQGTRRFDVSLGRGLSSFVGRDDELSLLQAVVRKAENSLQVVDIVAEPGLGKTRLLFEFQAKLGGEKVLLQTGHCTADARNTPFLPFIEIIRGLFALKAEDSPEIMARKLDDALRMRDLHSAENLGILMNLLGLAPPEASLAGLDGVLIGLRTRDLLPKLLKAHCRDALLVLILEDTHWIDRASEEILAGLVNSIAQPNLLIVSTRRPEYLPAWRDDPKVIRISLKPLSSSSITILLQSRLGEVSLPEALTQQVADRAGGNPLFGEEILGFLIDRGALRLDERSADFVGMVTEDTLPLTLQGLLATRTDRLPGQDRALLQVAATIGRKFSAALLSLVITSANADDLAHALKRLQAQDIVYQEPDSKEYAFKHILLRDSVYQSLLSANKAELHLKVAEALERLNTGRVYEVAETLAYHYALSSNNDAAFRYLVMAGAKALGVFSLDDADRYFASALQLHEQDAGCASDEQLADLLAKYALCTNISLRIKTMLVLAENYTPRLRQMGDSHNFVRFLHHYVATLIWSARYAEAHTIQRELVAMAERLGGSQNTAFALVSEVAASTYFNTLPLEAFEVRRRQTEAALATVTDAHLHNYYYAVLSWDRVNRGLILEARAALQRLMDVGVAMNDPRSIGYASAIGALLSIVSDNYEEGLQKAEFAIGVARVPFDIMCARTARISALVLLKRPDAITEVERHLAICAENGWANLSAGPDSLLGIALALDGRIGTGLRRIEDAIARREQEGWQASADWARLFLAEVYLDILTAKGEASLSVMLRNIGTLTRVFLSGQKRILELIEQIRTNPQFDRDGHHLGRAEMILGLLHKAKGRKKLALKHLTEAKRILDPFGSSPILSRIDRSLSEITDSY